MDNTIAQQDISFSLIIGFQAQRTVLNDLILKLVRSLPYLEEIYFRRFALPGLCALVAPRGRASRAP